MTKNLFEYATRNKLRFASSRGELTVEQLWDAPLRGAGFDLNTIAKTASKALKEISEENFVETSRKTAEHVRREAVLDTVKYVIETKLVEEEAAATRAANKQEKDRLLAILADKQDGKLTKLSEQELQRRIAALD